MAKRESRTSKRERLLREAAAVNLPKDCDVTVVGGGAAGLVAAVVAAEAGASVVVLERDLECGRPILTTGNGRCNFANISLDPRHFNDPKFVSSVCGTRWLDDVLSFFRESGLRWSLEDDRLYPLSRQASSVRNVLLARARKAGVVLAPAREFHDVSWIASEHLGDLSSATHYSPSVNKTLPAGMAEVTFSQAFDEPGASLTSSSRAVILASGGAPLPSIVNVGIATAPCTPVLCPLACEPSPLHSLDGRRVYAEARLTKADSFFPSWKERGEVLFRPYGISGIVTFDLSRRTEAGDLVELDLVPDVSRSDLQRLVDPLGTGSFEPGCLDGIMDPIIAAKLERLARERWHIEWPEHEPADTDSNALMALVKALPLVVQGSTETDHAQVTRGGLRNDQFDPATLAARGLPWLYACGEALDVDADCGGYNLSWAWKSGMVAGEAAAQWALS